MTSNNFPKTDYLLIDNIENFTEISNYTSKQIVTFDYKSHIALTEQKIPHMISDKFHSMEDLQSIENLIYSFTKWYEIPSIKNLISDNGINLGELFFLEFRTELVSFMKKFIEISNLVKLNPNSHYFASKNIVSLLSTLTENTTEINIKNENLSLYDTIDVPLKFGSKQLTLKLSIKTASKIQKFLNKLTKSFFSNTTIIEKSPTILVVNFSTIKTEKFLLDAKNFNFNIIKYDRTTPSMWNLETFNIIKNSSCIIENEHTLLDKISLEKIKVNENSFLEKLDTLLLSKDMESFFSIDGKSFWIQIKPLLQRLCKKYFLQASKEIEITKNLFKKYSFSKILLFHESGIAEQIVLNLGKQHKIPVFVLQHGLYFDSNEMIDENHFQRIIPQKSDCFLTWGDAFSNYLLKNNIDSKQIKNIGSIFHDKIYQKNFSSKTNSGNILLASDPLAFNRLIDLSINQKELYNETIEKICMAVSQNNKKLIIKTHPQKHQHEEDISKKIDSKIMVSHSGNIFPLIESSDLVIVTDVTTVILEAMIMQKPVISIRIKDHYGKPEIFNYCNQIPLDSLDSWLKSFYHNPNIKNDLVNQGNEFLKKYFSNIGKSSEELLKFIQ